MSEYTALRITRTAQAAFAAGPAAYWLRMVQDEEDDLVTTGEVAELVDQLYDIDPCIATAETETGAEEEEQEQPEEEDLYRVAKDVFGADLVACRAALSGDYTAEIKIYRSHPEEAYKLVLSAGEVVRTVVANERITESIDVQSASSVDLEYAISAGIAAGWLGPVIGQTGLIAAPEIKRSGNTLYWDGPATGTIRTDFETSVDIVTVDVPGLPIFPASDVGTAQDVKVLAFYHMMVFPGEIRKPVEDDSITAGELKQLCGYNDSGVLDDADDSDAPLPAPPEPPDYGCQAWEPALAEPSTYMAFCCKADLTPYACVLKTARNPGGKDLSQEERERFLAINPRTSFQAVTPPGAEGCGTIYYELMIAKNSCCDEATPLAWNDADSGDVVSPGGMVKVYVDGGLRPLVWHIRGQGFWGNPAKNLRDVSTDGRSLMIYTDSTACGTCQITVTDGCTATNGSIKSTAGYWRSIPPEQVPPEFRGIKATTHLGNVNAGCGRGMAHFEAETNKYRFRQYYTVVVGDDAATSFVSCETACAAAPDDWHAFIGEAQSLRAGMPNGEIELIDMHSSIELITEYDLVIMQGYWNGYGVASIEVGDGAIGINRSCNPAESIKLCTTGAAVLAGDVVDRIGCYTNPQAEEWVCS